MFNKFNISGKYDHIRHANLNVYLHLIQSVIVIITKQIVSTYLNS